MKKVLSIFVIIMVTIVLFASNVKAEDIKIDAPNDIKAEIVSNGIKLTWNNVNGAKKYEIYRDYLDTGNFDKIMTVETNSFIDTTANYITRFFYKIKAVKENGETSDFSTVVFMPYVSAPNPSIKSYNDKAILKWERNKYVDGYTIYRSTSKEGTYEKIKTINNNSTTSYTDKNIKAKTVYYYKIKAYKKYENKDYYSADSKIVEKTKYAQVKIKDSYSNDNKKSITIKWKKVSGVTGYQIYRATSKNGTYKKIKTIKKKGTTSYTDKKDIGLGKLYYYKIRAYKNNGNQKEYGQFSSKRRQTTGSRKKQINKIKLKPGTTGFKELDSEYKKIIKKATKGKNNNYDKVKAVYKYVVDHMSHDDFHCKQFNGTFAAMIKVLGIEKVYCARGYTSTTSGGWAEHTWTIIEINDTRYVFDTSLDRHVKDRTKKINYSKFFKTEKEVKNSYKLSYYHSDAWPVKLSTKEFGYIYY